MKDEVTAVSRSFILHTPEAEAVRLERTRALDARRLSTPLHYRLCDASEEEGAGVEPAEAFSGSDSFRDCLACPCPTFRVSGGDARTRTGKSGFGVRQSLF